MTKSQRVVRKESDKQRLRHVQPAAPVKPDVTVQQVIGSLDQCPQFLRTGESCVLVSYVNACAVLTGSTRPVVKVLSCRCLRKTEAAVTANGSS